jgi:hypothetical protein
LEDKAMGRYKSFFEDVKSVKTQWGLGDTEAKKVYEIWDMAYDELKTSDDNNFKKIINETRDYFAQKPGIFDEPDPNYKRVKVTITSAQRARLVNTYGTTALLRMIGTGDNSKRQMLHKVWSGIKGKEGGDVDAAKQTANKFNTRYGPDEYQNYLQYLSDKKKAFGKKPYLVPEGQDNFSLYVWYRA